MPQFPYLCPTTEWWGLYPKSQIGTRRRPWYALGLVCFNLQQGKLRLQEKTQPEPPATLG